MRIGIDCRIYNSSFTGIGRYTQELIKNFIELNYDHELILFFNNPAYSKFTPRNSNIKKVLVNAPHYSFKEQTLFLKKLNSENLDLVHFPHFNVPIFYSKPYIVTIHDLTLTLFPGQKMTRWYHRLAYYLTIKNAVKRAKKIIAVSNNTKQDIITHLKVPSHKIEVIENGVSPIFTLLQDQTQINKTLKKFNIKTPFLLYTGVWRSHKNLPRLIEAFNILRTERNLDLQLVLTGKPDPHYPEVQQAIKDLNLTPHVILTNLVSEKELLHLYNAARIYVFPSLYEGFGLPPLESMKCGTPAAVSNTSSIPEICGPENAVYFDPYTPQDIANTIENLYKDAALQADLIASGIAHASKFTWEKTAEKTYHVLCSNLSKNS